MWFDRGKISRYGYDFLWSDIERSTLSGRTLRDCDRRVILASYIGYFEKYISIIKD
jgi:hypothetical protein